MLERKMIKDKKKNNRERERERKNHGKKEKSSKENDIQRKKMKVFIHFCFVKYTFSLDTFWTQLVYVVILKRNNVKPSTVTGPQSSLDKSLCDWVMAIVGDQSEHTIHASMGCTFF